MRFFTIYTSGVMYESSRELEKKTEKCFLFNRERKQKCSREKTSFIKATMT